jgi:uncharacterized protein (TIGR02145 family)
MIDNSQKTKDNTYYDKDIIDRTNDGVNYGLLYSSSYWNSWDDACPDGWSVPTYEDFNALKSALTANGASAWADWNSGSSLAGFGSDSGNYYGCGYWWSRNGDGWLVHGGATSGKLYTSGSGYSNSVRCLKYEKIPTGAGVTDVDGNVYRTKIYHGVEWMIDNSQKTTGVTGCTYRSISGDSYGRLYSRSCAAKACPNGWSLPTDKDFNALESALISGGSSAWDDWNSGYSLAGHGIDGNHLYGIWGFRGGSYGGWWSSSSINRYWRVEQGRYNTSTIRYFSTYGNSYSLSVRCRKSQ